MLAALDQRPTRRPPHGQQLCLLIRAGVLTSAFERLGQERVGERLARDPLGVERVGLAAVVRSGAIRAHIPHVMAAAES